MQGQGLLVHNHYQGGFGIVDPLQQSTALLVKLVIRGLLAGPETIETTVAIHIAKVLSQNWWR